MERREVVVRLKGLREELEKDGVLQDITLTLFLSDVCNVLELSQEEHNEVLGQKVSQAIEEWRSTKVWLAVEKEETATYPLTELAAISA